MADRIPLRIVNLSSGPTIGEFRRGDTLGVVHGGTGVSSISELSDALGLSSFTLSSDMDDVTLGFPVGQTATVRDGQVLIWDSTYQRWTNGNDSLSALVDTDFTNLSSHQHISWNGTAWVNVYNDTTEMRVRNGTASAMSKGDVIAIEDAHNANLVNVILADASQTSAMPALGILDQDLAAGAEGIAITFGKAQGLNTSGLTEGATAYVSPTTPGGIVDTRPTANNHLVQNIGIVMRAHPSNGAIKVTGIGRANDIPNDVSSNIASNTSAIENSAQLSDVSVELSSLVSSIHHGDLSGLGDNDHPQYVLSSTNSALSAQVDANTSAIDDAYQLSDIEAFIDHGSIAGLSDNDHPQYVLSSTNSALSAQVDTNTSAIDNALDLSDIVAFIEHGDLNGLGDNDHPQYVLSATNSALSSLVTNIETSTVDLSSYIAANESSWSTGTAALSGLTDTNISSPAHNESLVWTSATGEWINASVAGGGGVTDHGLLTGLSDNDHPQYVLSATNNALSSLVTSIETSTVDLSSYIAANETTWSTDNDTTDHTALSNIGTNTHAQIDSHIASGSVHFTEASIDHGSIAGLGDNDHPQYVLSSTNNALSSLVTNVEGSTVSLSSYIAANETTWSTDNDTTDHTALSNIGTNTHTDIDNHISDITKHYTVASIDHGSIAGLGDNDHPQYVLSATNNALSSLVTSVETSTVSLSSYIAANETTWSTDNDTTDHTALSNIGTNTHAQIDSHIASGSVHFTEASIDHGSIAGLADNDHPQYVLSSTNNALSSLVTSVETSTVSLSSYIAANETTWSTDNDTTDHTALSNIGTNTHAQIDSHIADSTIHFTEASIDHGSIAGLADNDHPQYVLSATNNALSSLVTSVETSTVNLSGYIAANETTWATDTDTTDHTALTNIGTNTHAQIDSHIADSTIHFTEASIDHGSIAGLADNDHPQYVLSSTNQALSSLVTNVEGSTVSLSSYIAANETTWATDTDTTDHTALTNIGTNTHAQIDTHIADSTIHFTEASIDHTNISNIGTNTHAQIDSHITGVTTASGNWESTYNTVLNSSGSWGGGGGTSDHGALTGLADNDHPQYVLSATNAALSSLVTNTTDVSGIVHGNLSALTADDHTQYSLVDGTRPVSSITIHDTYSGTVGDTSIGYGIETVGNLTNKAGNYILFSATTGYQFRQNGLTTYTSTTLPNNMRNWDSTYNTVLNSSGSWGGGGGGGGGVAAGITIVNTGTDNINSTGGALVPLDTSTSYPAYGTYGTDYSYTAGNSYVTVNTAGTYEVTFNVGYTTVTARWNGILKIYKGTGGASPSAWIGYGAGKMGYVRNSSGHNEASLIVTCLVTCSANDTIGGHVINEGANGTCTLVANETFMTIKRMS